MEYVSLEEAVDLLVKTSDCRGRNLQMPGDPHYQPVLLRPYLGYDQRAGWLILAEWFWLTALAKCRVMPGSEAQLLTPELLFRLLNRVTTTKVTELERAKTKHDILALLELMRRSLPKALHRWLHFGTTSYDTICTAYALQARETFSRVFNPKISELDKLWREHIRANANILQMGRTHLQDALPITVGCWLSVLHDRFVRNARNAGSLAREIPGKFSGAVGTKAALRVLIKESDPEAVALEFLRLPPARLSTQITQPEGLERFYNEMTLISAALSNLGDDIRHLQASAIGEVMSASSTSSTMSHKGANPVGAEQMDGMYVTVRGEFFKVVETLNSTLQRDLRWSNVMRGFPAILVFTFQQLLTAEKVLGSFRVSEARCWENFKRAANVLTAELLHLSLQAKGYLNAHAIVNTQVVPAALISGRNLVVEMDAHAKRATDEKLRKAWRAVSAQVKEAIAGPQSYVGDAIQIAEREAENALKE